VSRVVVRAYAKINLSLEVLGKRPDGYHAVRTVMQSVDISDQLVMERAEGLSLECDRGDLSGEENLVLRAARALGEATGVDGGAKIRLSKGIPVAAGLGGASADAAAALVGLCRLWGIECSPDDLLCLASTLGSDVSFFLIGGTALASGRGEEVSPLPDAPAVWVVLLVPSHSLAGKTAEMYRRLSPDAWTDGRTTNRLVESILDGCLPPEDLLRNCFDPFADAVFPELPLLRRAMLEAGAAGAHLSGAGPALFALFADEMSALSSAARLRSLGHRPLVARTLGSAEARPYPLVI